MLSLLPRLTQVKQNMLEKLYFFILEEQRTAEIKQQQNNDKNTTKSPLQFLFSAITVSQ